MNKKNNPKTETIHLRVTTKEKDMIERKANKNNITLTEYVRMTIRKSLTNKATSGEQRLIILQAYIDDLIEAVTSEDGNASNAKIRNLIKELEQI